LLFFVHNELPSFLIASVSIREFLSRGRQPVTGDVAGHDLRFLGIVFLHLLVDPSCAQKSSGHIHLSENSAEGKNGKVQKKYKD
jgi:hypothetical protein